MTKTEATARGCVLLGLDAVAVTLRAGPDPRGQGLTVEGANLTDAAAREIRCRVRSACLRVGHDVGAERVRVVVEGLAPNTSPAPLDLAVAVVALRASGVEFFLLKKEEIAR